MFNLISVIALGATGTDLVQTATKSESGSLIVFGIALVAAVFFARRIGARILARQLSARASTDRNYVSPAISRN
jgi:hypothetical protein